MSLRRCRCQGTVYNALRPRRAAEQQLNVASRKMNNSLSAPVSAIMIDCGASKAIPRLAQIVRLGFGSGHGTSSQWALKKKRKKGIL